MPSYKIVIKNNACNYYYNNIKYRKGGIVMKYLTVKEFAEMFRLSPQTVYLMIGDGRVNTVRIGKAIRIPAEEIERIEKGEKA